MLAELVPCFARAFRRERTVLFSYGFVLALSGGTSFPGPPLNTDGEHSGPP
jgi:hypothetical protein